MPAKIDPVGGVIIEFGALPQVILDDLKNPTLIRDAQIAAIDFVQPLVQRVLWQNTPVGTGLARTLIQYERPNRYDPDPVGRVGYAEPASNYMIFPEIGTPPHWSPLQPLMMWGARKFGDPMVGWYVRFAIARRGTRAQWFVKRTAEELIGPATSMMIDRLNSFFAEPWNRIRNR